jgi:hypothetical protein
MHLQNVIMVMATLQKTYTGLFSKLDFPANLLVSLQPAVGTHLRQSWAELASGLSCKKRLSS